MIFKIIESVGRVDGGALYLTNKSERLANEYWVCEAEV